MNNFNFGYWFLFIAMLAILSLGLQTCEVSHCMKQEQRAGKTYGEAKSLCWPSNY